MVKRDFSKFDMDVRFNLLAPLYDTQICRISR